MNLLQLLKVCQAGKRGDTGSVDEAGEVHIVRRGGEVQSSACKTIVRRGRRWGSPDLQNFVGGQDPGFWVHVRQACEEWRNGQDEVLAKVWRQSRTPKRDGGLNVS